MGFDGFRGGMGVAYQGARRGVQDGIDDRQAAEDRQFLLDQRNLQKGQQQRALDAQARQDTLRTDLSSIKPAGTEVPVQPVPEDQALKSPDASSPDAQNGSDAGFDVNQPAPTPKLRTRDQELRDMADAYQKSGDSDKAYAMRAEAGKIQFGRATNQFNQALAGSDGQSIGTLARRLGSVYDSDPLSGGVKAIQDIPGGVRITIHNKDTGATDTREFTGDAGRKQLIDEFRAYYTPETFAQMQAEAYKAHVKAQGVIAEEAAKSHVVGNGGAVIRPDGSVIQTEKQFPPSAADGKNTPEGVMSGIITEALTKGDAKFQTPQVYASARDMGMRVLQNNPGIPPERAAQIAVDATVDPTKVSGSVNPDTGTIDATYQDASGKQYLLMPGYMDAETATARGMSPDRLKQQVGDMLSKQGPPEVGKQFAAAAFDKSARENLLKSASLAVENGLREAVMINAKSPSPKPDQALRAAAQQQLAAIQASVDRKLALVRTAYSEDELGVGPPPVKWRLPKFAGGLFGDQIPTPSQDDMISAGSPQLP